MAAGDQNYKTCNGQCYCQYKCLSTTDFGCNYSGYCDFQAPRDSRDQILDLRYRCTCGTSTPCKFHTGEKMYSNEQEKFRDEFEPDRNG